jgi:hypothetical protein
MKKSKFGKEVVRVKTSLELPEELWRMAKFRAAEEKKPLAEVIADALREHLRPAKKGTGRDSRARPTFGKRWT